MVHPCGSDGKESVCNAGDPGSIPGLGSSAGEGHGNPTAVLLPGKFHEQRSLTGYSPWGCKELDITEWLTHAHTHTQSKILKALSLLYYKRKPPP